MQEVPFVICDGTLLDALVAFLFLHQAQVPHKKATSEPVHIFSCASKQDSIYTNFKIDRLQHSEKLPVDGVMHDFRQRIALNSAQACSKAFVSLLVFGEGFPASNRAFIAFILVHLQRHVHIFTFRAR